MLETATVYFQKLSATEKAKKAKRLRPGFSILQALLAHLQKQPKPQVANITIPRN